MYICRACKCCIKGTNSFFEFSDRAPMYIKSFIISMGHLLMLVNIDSFKVSNSNTVATCETCSKLTINTPELSNLNL